MLNGLKFIVAAFALFVLLAVAAAQAPSAAPTQDTGYRLTPEDVITITTRDVPEASGDFLIRKDGMISFTYVGEIKVVGMTTHELEQLLTERLKKQITDPHVLVNLKTSSVQRVYVMGNVHTPGVVDWKPKWCVTQALAAAGGLSSAPERTNVILFRVGAPNRTVSLKKVLVEGNDAENVPIEPGDVLNVQSDITVRVTVVGEVPKPGSVEVLQGQGIAEALALAGGKEATSRLTGATMRRKGQEVPIDLYGAVTKAHPDADVTVEEGDTIFVPSLLTKMAVMGAVTKPGAIPVEDGQKVTLTEAIALAGGFAPHAITNGVTIMSQNTDGKITSKKYDVKKLLAKKNPGEGAPVLNDGDVVYVAESGKATTWQEISSALFPISFLSRFIP